MSSCFGKLLGMKGREGESLIMSYFPRGWRVHYVADLLEKYMTGKSSGGGSLIRQLSVEEGGARG